MIPGFYGKIPLKGDFIQRRLERSFTGNWDNWMQESMQESRACLGNDWLETYLISPLWRFALSSGLLSDTAMSGVVMPSVYTVGRHFPLMLAVEIPTDVNLCQLAIDQDKWFEGLEDIALYGLADDFNMTEFEQRLEQHPFTMNSIAAVAMPPSEGRFGWTHISGTSKALISAGYSSHISQQVRSDYSLWWTEGSDSVSSTFLIYDTLPPKTAYTAFISGNWSNG